MSFSPPPRPYPADRYHAADGEVSARWRVRDAPNDLVTSTGSCDYLATGLTTNGDYGLYRWTMGPEPSGPAPHCHRALSESFFVLTGTIRLFDGTRWADGGPGDVLYVPEGGLHGIRNESSPPREVASRTPTAAPRVHHDCAYGTLCARETPHPNTSGG